MPAKARKETNKMSEALRLTVPGYPEYIKIAKMAVGQIATMQGASIDTVQDVQTAVSEACRLITCHGHPCWSDCIDVSCHIEEGKLLINVADKDGSHSIEKDELHRCVECPQEGDMGIKLIEYIMDNVEITRANSGCRSIKITKILS